MRTKSTSRMQIFDLDVLTLFADIDFHFDSIICTLSIAPLNLDAHQFGERNLIRNWQISLQILLTIFSHQHFFRPRKCRKYSKSAKMHNLFEYSINPTHNCHFIIEWFNTLIVYQSVRCTCYVLQIETLQMDSGITSFYPLFSVE